HSEAPPMMVFCGAPGTPASYGSGGTSSSTGGWHGRARGSGSGQPDRGRTARTRAGSAIHASARRRAASGIAAADRADAAERHAER
ncbi:hypothetical protein ACQCRC_20135, partial [Ralstonia pseudosolanacearum]|uniref:hypothetical protein n=1 Tax=Ralstonia pseudosolanacearum TaxID=1310165 RepID=UPI003CF41ED4